MKVTSQMMAKFEKCKSAEEILELAKKENIFLNLEQAQMAFDLLKLDDVSDEMMEKVVGGGAIYNLQPCDKTFAPIEKKGSI